MADKEFLEYVVKAIVDNPSAVSVDRKVDEMGVLITLKTDPADMGKVMGALMPKVQGQADGSVVSKVVRELLGV